MSVQPIVDFNLMESSKKAAITGVITGASSALLFGETGSANIGPVNVPTFVLVGLFGAAASYTADLSHTYILPKIPVSSAYTNMEVVAANGVAGAAGMIIGNQLFIGGLSNESMLKLGLLGGASVIAGDIAYNSFANPKLSDQLF